MFGHERSMLVIKAGTVNANFIYSPWMKDQFCHNVVFRRLNLDEKGKVFAESIHFGIDFKPGVGKIRRVMSNPHSKIDPNMSGY